MRKQVEAIYENGVLRPLEPLAFDEHQRVAVIVTEVLVPEAGEDWLDVECLEFYAGEADDSVSLQDVRAAMSKIPGSLVDDFVAERDEV